MCWFILQDVAAALEGLAKDLVSAVSSVPRIIAVPSPAVQSSDEANQVPSPLSVLAAPGT